MSARKHGSPDLGPALRRLRERRGDIGVRELARRLGVEPATVSRWEKGAREISAASLLEFLRQIGSSMTELEHEMSGENGPTEDDESEGAPPDEWMAEEDERVDRDLERDNIRRAALDYLKRVAGTDTRYAHLIDEIEAKGEPDE